MNNFLFFIAFLLITPTWQRSFIGEMDGFDIDDAFGKFFGAGDLVGAIRDPSLTPAIGSFQLAQSWRRQFGNQWFPPQFRPGNTFSKSGGTDGWYYGSSS